MNRVKEAVKRLTAITEDQIVAARTLRGDDLSDLNTRRVDALFALRIALAEDGLPKVDPAVKDEVRRLAAAEKRLATIAQTVLDRVARIDVAAPPTVYDRCGRLG
ncbi:MAG: hypothetical protein ABMA64_22260 [Myxococcota bacterium]